MATKVTESSKTQLSDEQKRKMVAARKIGGVYRTLAKQVSDEWANGTDEKMALLKTVHTNILGKDKSGNLRPINDLQYFLFQAAQRKLNPFKGQIHAVYIWDGALGAEKLIPITGINGFIAIAQRTGRYAGMSECVWEINQSTKLPIKATVDVFAYNPVSGKREVVNTATAWYDEYVKLVNEKVNGKSTGNKVPNSVWANRPNGQLEKCAQALAIRRTFPEEVGGLYVWQEMDHLIGKDHQLDEPEETVEDTIQNAVAEHQKANATEGEVVEAKK
jgi:phage recombination protein Bet